LTNPQGRAYSAVAVEQLLSSLAGIRSARVVAMEPGTLDEIHILCAPALQPKQVVRNIESALCAGLGIRIDRRIVSVAQLRTEVDDELPPDATPQPAPNGDAPIAADSAHATHTEAADAPARPTDAAAAPRDADSSATTAAHTSGATTADTPAATSNASTTSAPLARPAPQRARPQYAESTRFLFVGYDAATQGGRSECSVTIRRGRRPFTSIGTGSDSRLGRAAAAAEAVIRAVGEAAGTRVLGLDGVAIVELGSKPFALVSALALDGRETTRLTGMAALVRSPEEAAILAGLQAANRWSESR
jgi:hypothetical protein